MSPTLLRTSLVVLVLTAASASRSVLRKRQGQVPGPSDEYEYGDRETQESSADSSDFSMHQFLANDDARDATSSSNGAEEMAKAKALAAADHFNSEDTPDPSDSLVQTGRAQRRAEGKRTKTRQMPFGGDEYEYGDKESQESSADSSDFSLHQFLAEDDARDGASRAGDSTGATEMAAAKALAAQDHFSSEDTPDPDAFAQTGESRRLRRSPGDDDDDQTGYEYGDRQANARNEDSSDFSVHQFLVRDDGREGSDTSKDADGGAAAEKARSKALKAQTHFDSEDTPDK